MGELFIELFVELSPPSIPILARAAAAIMACRRFVPATAGGRAVTTSEENVNDGGIIPEVGDWDRLMGESFVYGTGTDERTGDIAERFDRADERGPVPEGGGGGDDDEMTA